MTEALQISPCHFGCKEQFDPLRRRIQYSWMNRFPDPHRPIPTCRQHILAIAVKLDSGREICALLGDCGK